MSTSRASRLTGVGSLSLLVFTMILLSVASVGRADETVQVCGSYANQVFARTPPVKGITVKGTCPNPPLTANGFALYSSGTSTRGVSAHWQATAPTGLAIVGASTKSMVSAGLNSRWRRFRRRFLLVRRRSANARQRDLGRLWANLLELFWVSARLRREQLHAASPARHRSDLALRS